MARAINFARAIENRKAKGKPRMNLPGQYRLSACAVLLLGAAIPFAAFGSHGGSGGGSGSGGGGGGHGGGSGGTAQDVCPIVAPDGEPTVIVPGTVLVRETFGFGPQLARPEGGNGSLRQVSVGTDLGGFWAEQPCDSTTIWMAPSGESWIFAASSTDPKEAPSNMMPAFLGNGAAAVHRDPETVLEHPAALVPFQPPSIPYEVSVDTVPPGPPDDWFDAGFTASNALNDNFESAGQAWMRVKYSRQLPYSATVELHTNGLSGPSVSAVFPSSASNWDTLTVRYDPALELVTGFFNGQLVGTLSYDASSARFAGFEGDSTADNFVLKASE